jgi:hypothetical protein
LVFRLGARWIALSSSAIIRVIMSGSLTDRSLPLHLRALQLYLRSQWRCRTKLTTLLATYLPSLQTVPIPVGPRTLYVDLRDVMAHDLLRNAPYGEELWEADEQALMHRVVKSGEVAFDIGAHFGEHTVLLSEARGARRPCVRLRGESRADSDARAHYPGAQQRLDSPVCTVGSRCNVEIVRPGFALMRQSV